MQSTPARNLPSLARRVLMALAIPVWIIGSFAVFWSFPGNDAEGEGPGHVIAHLTWAGIILAVGLWFWRRRDGYVLHRSARLTMIGLFAAVGAQLVESVGAAIVWGTGMSEHGNFVLHDVAAAGLGTVAMALVAAGLVSLVIGAIARSVRARSLRPRISA